MVGKPDLLVMTLLRRIGERIGDVLLDTTDLKDRMSLLEMQYASHSRRTDRIGVDVRRIKDRLEITEGEV